MRFLTLEDFSTHINETFMADVDQGRTPFTLVEAKPLPAPIQAGAVRAPFSLVFHSALQVLLPQRIYQMKHASMDEFGIFLVPVARNRDGFLYQAVFS